MGAPFTASRDSCPGADAKFLAGFMAKNFVAGASHPGQMERERRRRGPPAFQAGVSLPGFSGGLAGHTPAGAGE
ncbi:Uncharacterised protein [Shigella sonnei]|nr:Uncharacterised protein [Shigella sonnei]